MRRNGNAVRRITANNHYYKLGDGSRQVDCMLSDIGVNGKCCGAV